MKKTLLSLAIVAVAAATLMAVGPVNAEAANGNAYGHYKSPGNSAWGRSHNPNAQVLWGNQYESFDSLIARLQALIERLRVLRGESTNNNNDDDNDDSAAEVTTRSAESVDEDGATLRGEVDLEDGDEAEVWFEYGTSLNNLNKKTTPADIDEDEGDTVQFETKISGLSDDTRYYFRAVAEDEDGDKDYGEKLSFTTDDDDSDNNDETPDVSTQTAQNVDSDSAQLRGEVDMNDFDNGVVFFVFGEDEQAIEDVEDDFDSYEDIDEDGDDLKKVRVDTDLDDDESYTSTVESLDGDTTHYFAIGVAYEDEDGDDVIELGNVRSFTTD